MRRLSILVALAALAAPAAASAAAPHVTGTFAMPHGLVPGGFVEHGTVAGPGNNLWMTTEAAEGSSAKPVLLRVGANGKTGSVKINVAGGMSFTGVDLGPGGQVWFSGTTGAGAHNGVNGVVAGTTAHFTIAPDSTSWDQLAVLGSTAYATDGFDDLLTSTTGQTFGDIRVSNVDPFDIVPFAGGFAVAGDGAIGILSAASLAASPATATLLTATTTPGSRYETVAGGRLWFLEQVGDGEIAGLGDAGPDGSTTIGPIDPAARNITTGPDGMAWVLTNTAAERIGPSGAVTAKVKLPAGQTGILIGGASSKYVWVGTLNRSSGKGSLVRIAVS
jgi:hypothetical protein